MNAIFQSINDAISGAPTRPVVGWDLEGYDYGSDKRELRSLVTLQSREPWETVIPLLGPALKGDPDSKSALNRALVARVVYIARDGGSFNVILRKNDITNSPYLPRRVVSRVVGLPAPKEYGQTWVSRVRDIITLGVEYDPATLAPFFSLYDTRALALARGDVTPDALRDIFHTWAKGVRA